MIDAVVKIDAAGVDRLIDASEADPEALIGILQDVQKEWGFLPIPALKRVSERLGVPYNRVWAVATFYEAFTFQPHGRTHIMVCTGTTCHVNDGLQVLRAIEGELMIECGQSTPDGEFSLENVHCLGACGVGPMVVVNGQYHGHMTRAKVIKLLDELKTRTEVSS
jgi:NADH-quinone oxidoreductase subunit E